MARKPQVRFFASRNAYYCQIGGRQHKLADGPDDSPHGPQYLAALKAYGELMAYGTIDTAGNENTVRTIFNAYLTWVQKNKRPNTYKIRLGMLKPFEADHGGLRVSQVKPYHLEQTIARMKEPRTMPGGTGGTRSLCWTNGTVRLFLNSLKGAFRWALDQGLLDKVPLLKTVKVPAQRSRARERIVSPEEHQLILSKLTQAHSQRFRRLVIALENTGARPGELANATVADWNDSLGAVVYFADDKRREDEFAHKTSGKGKDRTIRFTGEALEMVRQLIDRARSKKDLLFPANTGLFTPRKIVSRFETLQQGTGLSNLVAYSYRHTFATRWLLNGRNVDVLAELLGNSPETIRKHYSHLCQQHEAVRAQLEAFRQDQAK